MSDTPLSPESAQIADVAINEEETIVRRPALEQESAAEDGQRSGVGDPSASGLVGPAGLEPAT